MSCFFEKTTPFISNPDKDIAAKARSIRWLHRHKKIR